MNYIVKLFPGLFKGIGLTYKLGFKIYEDKLKRTACARTIGRPTIYYVWKKELINYGKFKQK